tara:strand:+ start:10342 stop:10800 length:459 start_codon:yes stop_codon:yes gene_type:complete
MLKYFSIMIAILREDLKKAITSKDKVATNAIRSVIAAIGNEGKDAENSEEKVIKTINKEIKKRKDAIALYKENNRDDLKDIEEGELKILEKYLPEQMSEEEVKKEVLRIYESLQSAENVNMGILMKESVKQLSGKADNGMISKIAKEIISSK